MKFYKINLSLVAFFSILNAASSSNDDGNVLLLTQIGRKGHTCCISPLISQKDGLSVGPKAEWVSAKFELTDGANTLSIPDNVFCPWTLINGGSIKCQSSSSKWNCIKVFPDISEKMRKILSMDAGESIFFEIGVSCFCGKLTIVNSAIMVRKSTAREIRKRTAFFRQMTSPSDGMTKVILEISDA